MLHRELNFSFIAEKSRFTENYDNASVFIYNNQKLTYSININELIFYIF